MKRTSLVVSLFLILPLAGRVQKIGRRHGAQPRGPSREATARRSALQARLKECGSAFRSGRYAESAACFEAGYRSARGANQADLAARFLANLGACQLALHRYRLALESSLEARKLAESAQDAGSSGAIDANIASIYEQMGETGSAIQWAGRALERIAGRDREKHLPKLLIQAASLDARQGDMTRAAALFREGIALADRIGDLDTYALGCDRLGEEHLKRGELAPAEGAMLEAFRIRKLQRLAALDTSYRNLGRLRLAQGDVESASALLDIAVERSRHPRGLMPAWDIYHARGRVRLAQGRREEALEDFRQAVRLARTWRRGVTPSDAVRIGAEQLIDQAYASLVEAAAALYFRSGRAGLAREAFEAAEENRAASLRAVLAQDPDWQRRLPADYWETLARVQAAEVELLRHPGAPVEASIRRWQAELTGMETSAVRGGETAAFPDQARDALPPDAAYLAFHLGEPVSCLWALDRSGMAAYRLAGRAAIVQAADEFREAARASGIRRVPPRQARSSPSRPRRSP